MTSTYDLRVVDLQKHFEGFDLGPVSLEVPRGSVVGLIGQNGAGKTTLMKIILGMLRADAGHVELFGKDRAKVSSAELPALKARMGYVASETAYPLTMTIAEVARMYALSYPAFDMRAFQSLCHELELGDDARKAKDLSRGMGMKLQLACVLASGASMLVLDEPTAGLDPIVRLEMLDVLREWMKTDDRSILVSSHITSDLEHLADYLVMVHKGKVTLACSQDEVAAFGVARLRSSELDRVLQDHAYEPGSLRILARDLSHEVLVPDRAAFVQRYPDYVCDSASIDDVMAFVAKGEVR